MAQTSEANQSENQPQWDVRPYREDDMPALLELYGLVFGRERTAEDFRWKLLRPAPVDTVWVADEEGTVIGQHAGIFTPVQVGGRELPAMHAVEAMTHPGFRRQGMLTRLGGGLYGYWADSGMPLILGLPHPGWGSRAYALGYRETFPLRWVSRPLRPVAMLRARLARFSSPAKPGDAPVPAQRWGNLSVERVDRAEPQFDTLWETIKSDYSNCVVRNREWVQWRYLDAPAPGFTVLKASRGGQLSGYIAYRTILIGNRLIGRIADLFAAREDRQTQDALIRAANRHLRAQGADSVATLVAVGSPAYDVFRRNLFLLARGEYKVSFITPSTEVTLDSLSDPSKWHLMGGDFDVV
jgi:hypothetical protein